MYFFKKRIGKTISILTLIGFIFTNTAYSAPSSRSFFKNKRVDYKKLSIKNEERLLKKKAVLKGKDEKEGEKRKKYTQSVLSSHLKDLSQIHIPSELGRVIEVYQSQSEDKKSVSRLIVHIQDLHTNPEAELNLAKILEILIKDYSLDLVCSEGAQGKVDTSSVSSFPDYNIREKTARLFINSGELTGEEYLSITKYPDLPIWGIENKDIYFKNIIEFNRIIKFSPSSRVFILQAKKALEELKPKVYSKDILEIDQKEAEYESEQIETDKYLQFISSYIKKFNIPVDKYKNISLLTEAQRQEKTIDQVKIMQESQNLLLNLQSTLVNKALKSEMDSLIVKAGLFKNQKIAPFSFYSYLKDLALRHMPDKLNNYPHLNEFVDYLTKVNSLDTTKLFVEMEDLTYEVKTRLSKTDEQKTLVKALRNIKFLESFFNLKISNEELNYYLENKHTHKVAFFKEFLLPTLKKYNISSFIDFNPDLIDERLGEIESFYETVKKRDLAMVSNTIFEVEKRNAKVATLISGGFHTKGITRLLKDKGYSYIVISPYSSQDIDEENYHFLLSGRRKPIIELLKELDLAEMSKNLSDTLRVTLAFNQALREPFITELVPQLAEELGVPEEELTPENILPRMATILLLASGRLADRWQNPLARMEVRSPKSKEGIIIKVSPQEGNAKYFTLTVDAEGKVQIAKAKAIDFTGERIAEIGQMSTVAEVEIDKDRGKGSPLDLLKYLVENGYYEGNSISRGDLIEARGFSPEAVRLEINSLIAIGLLERTSTGRYSLTRRLTSREIDAIQRYAIGIINKRGLKGEKLGLDRWRLDDLGEEKIGAIAEFVRPTTLAGALEKVAQTYGLSLDSVSFTQVSGPVDDALGDPIENETVTASLHATNLTTLSSHFTAGCAIEALSEGRTADARAIKMVADGGAVTVLEKTLKAMAEDLDITLIIGGSEGKTRDGSPALTVKEVINPNGKNGIYIVHSDPIENTNSHAEDKPGAWVLFFLTRLPATYEVLLREDASSAGVGLQDFLEQRTGEDLAKYNIPFCHDRYVISVSYPGNAGAVKRAQFHPTDDPREILEKIADEHDISLEELGRRAHIVFLERERHDYKKEALDILREDGNQITYSTVTDGDAFARILAPLGMPTHEEKRWTIVLGGSGAIEGFATGLVTAGKVNKDGSLVGRVNMVHSAVPHKASAEYKPGQPLAGWDDYQEKDLRDFDSLGITDPAHVITDEEISEQYPESMVVAAAITGARENIDISSDLSIPRVTADGEYIEVSSFVIDEHGRSFLVTTRYKSSDPSYTRLSMRADNNYGFFDEESVDFAIQRLITAATDSERKTWEERLVDHLGPEQYVARLLALIEVGRDIDINFPVLNILNDLVALDEPLIVFIVKAALEMSEGKRKAFEAVFTDWKNEIPQETRDAYSVRLMESVIKGLEKWNDFFASVEGDTKRAMGLIHKTDKGFTSAGRNEPGSVTTTFPVEELNEVAPQNKVDLTATDEAGLVALMQPIERTHPYAPLRLVVALGEMLGGTGSRYQDSLREEPETIEEIEQRLRELGKFARSFKSSLPWGRTSHTILERQIGTNKNIGPVLAVMAAHNNHEEAVAFMKAVISILEAKDGQVAPQVVSFAQPIVPWRVPTREDFEKAIETDNQSFRAFTPEDIEAALEYCEAHAGEISLDEEGKPYFSTENHWDFVKYFIELGYIFDLLEDAMGEDGQVHDVILQTYNQDDMGAAHGIIQDVEGKAGYGTIEGKPRPGDIGLRVLMRNLQGEGGFYEFLAELDEIPDEEWEAYRQTEEFRERFRRMKCGIIEGGRMVGYGTGGGIFDVDGSTQVVEKLNIEGDLPSSDITNSNAATKSLLAEALMIGLRPKDIRKMIETKREKGEFSEVQQARVLRGLRQVESRSIPVRRQIKTVGKRVAQGLNKDIHGAFGRTYGVILLVGHSISTYEHHVGDIDRALLRGEIDFNVHQERELAIARFLTFVPVKHLGQWRAAQRVARSLDKYLGYVEESPVRAPEAVLAGLESQEPAVVLKALQEEGYYLTEEDLPLIGEWLKRTVVEKLVKQPKEIVRDIVTAGLSPEGILDGISDTDIGDDRLRSAKRDLLGLVALGKERDYLAFQEKMLLFSKDFSYIFGELSADQQEIYHRMMIAKSILARDMAIYYLDEANSGALDRLTQDAIAIMQDMKVGEYLTKTTSLTKSSRRQQTESMDEIVVIPASNVIADKQGFEAWIRQQPSNIAVVIISMQDEYDDVIEYESVAYIKVVGRDIAQVHNFKLIELFAAYEDDAYFGGFKLGTPASLDKYKAVVDSIASGV